MRILMINSVCGVKSTGRICTDLAVRLKAKGHEVKIAYGRGIVPIGFEDFAIKIGGSFNSIYHGLMSRLFDKSGFFSVSATKKFLKWVDIYKPDLIHLHNLHGYYINVPLLFKYIKERKIPVVWTFHDCWPFTGHCTYFDSIGCKKWTDVCRKCPQKKCYPKSFVFDFSKHNFLTKKRLYGSGLDMTIVTPSNWLESLVKNSFLKSFDTVVINNGVSTTTFHQLDSDFMRRKYNLLDKYVILGVASCWDVRKGLSFFIRLANDLNNDYAIVLIGLSKKEINVIPDRIICIDRTDSVEELATFYSLADIFVNPTLEDNYPTTNLEAISCGTPVISFDTGGSKESASVFGEVVEKGNYEALKTAIVSRKKYTKNGSISDIEKYANEYLKLYIKKTQKDY